MGLALCAIVSIIEIFLQDARNEVWEKFKEKNDEKLGNLAEGEDITNFEQFCALFGKSYKN